MANPTPSSGSSEDLGAVLDAAGEPSLVYGTSGCAVLALYGWAAGLAPRIRKLALWEPPFVVDASRPAVPADYRTQLTSLQAEGRRGDMVELFMTAAVGLPRELVASMRLAPWWPAQEALAHTLVYDATLMGDYSLPRDRIAAVAVPTLVLDGGTTPWLSHAAQEVAAALPDARRLSFSPVSPTTWPRKPSRPPWWSSSAPESPWAAVRPRASSLSGRAPRPAARGPSRGSLARPCGPLARPQRAVPAHNRPLRAARLPAVPAQIETLRVRPRRRPRRSPLCQVWPSTDYRG